MSNRDRLRGLYGITAPALLQDDALLLDAVESGLAGDMAILQYRNQSADHEQQLRQATALLSLCRRYQALFIINDDVELARAVGADGIHLGGEDAAIAEARMVLGDDAIIGRSCYNRLPLAREAQAQGADYVAFGRFFPSQTKPAAVQAEPELLALARSELAIPICAIGGITVANAANLIDRGANMIAVIHDLFTADDIEAQARQFSRLFA